MRLTRRPAGLPTAQCLRSAIVVNGAFRSKAKAKARRRPTGRPEAERNSCSRCRACEAATGCEAPAKPDNAVQQVNPRSRMCVCYAADRSLRQRLQTASQAQ
ncbi:hypothetical protein FJD36_03415 [Pseudomonas chlororaphis subsp. chlororaphis]|nr:hypothetical protein FJD36_03415 [Pseudomonas chlororaphis subsp. chlororaphis]